MRTRDCAAGLSIVLSLSCLVTLSGCSLAAYGLGLGTMVQDMKTRQREEYAQYRAEAELSRETPLTFRQWVRSHGG